MTQTPSLPLYTARLAPNGRIVIPAEVRRTLKLKPGAILTFRFAEDGALILEDPLAPWHRAQKRLSPLAKRLRRTGRSATDELLAERRLEAEHDLDTKRPGKGGKL